MFLFCFINLITFVLSKNVEKGKIPNFVGFGGEIMPVTPECLNWHIGQMMPFPMSQMPMMCAIPFQPMYTNPLITNQDALESITRNPNIRDLIKKTDKKRYEHRPNYEVSYEKGISEHKKEIKALLEEFIEKYRALKMKKYKKINQKEPNMENYYNYIKEGKEQKDLSREVDLLREDLIEDCKNKEDSSSQEEEEKEEKEEREVFEINNQSNGKVNNIQKPRIVFIRNPHLAQNVTNNI